MRRGLLRIGVAAVAVISVAAGCAQIPDTGPVTKVGADQGPEQSTVRYSPAGPVKDATPQQIVRGYLDAMLAYPVTTGIAAAFLTREAARAWKSSAGVEVYSQPHVSTPVITNRGGGVDKPTADVTAAVADEARLDQSGRYSGSDGHKNFDFRLVKAGGQWRISNPQAGFLVNRKFFEDYYRPFDVYFFDRTGKRLVASPIYVAVGDQLATTLISSLLLGPGNLIEGTARSYLPDNTQLRTSVPLRADGLADVQFRDDLSDLSSGDQKRISAQVIWTLRQVKHVKGVRITGGDNALYPGGRGIQSPDSWQSFGPQFGDGMFYGVQDDHIVRINGRTVDRVEGPWGTYARGATSLAVDQRKIAVVGARRDRLMIGSLSRKAVTTIDGEQLLSPQWDDSGNLWAVDQPGGTLRVRVAVGDRTRKLSIGRLGGYEARSFSLSPDGSRYAMVAATADGTGVFVGPVLRDRSDRPVVLGAPTRLDAGDSTFTKARSVSWSDDTTVTFLADDEVIGTQVFQARIDGSTIDTDGGDDGALLPSVAASELSTTGGDNSIEYVTDRSGRLWLLRAGASWQRLNSTGITALTPSRELSTR